MSIWGPGPFENDDGADWFAELRDEPSLEKIREALEEVAHPEHFGYHDVADGAEAIAAAEVLAELLGSPGAEPVLEEHEDVVETLTEEIKREDQRDIRKLVQRAIDAVGIILNDEENSELRQMWNEDPEGMAAWTTAMTGLQRRVRNAAIP
jgi:uncharacterized protein DUF4259